MDKRTLFVVSAAAVAVTFQLVDARSLHIQKRAAFYIANETACVVDNIVYYNGDPIPTDDPCESCKCRPPGFACVLRECEVKPGCKAVRRAGHCCPEYVCGCEHNGRMYRDGDEIKDSQNPCYTCHCQGSAIACSFVDCFFRVDCVPEYSPGECCPKYPHCSKGNESEESYFEGDSVADKLSTDKPVKHEEPTTVYLGQPTEETRTPQSEAEKQPAADVEAETDQAPTKPNTSMEKDNEPESAAEDSTNPSEPAAEEPSSPEGDATNAPEAEDSGTGLKFGDRIPVTEVEKTRDQYTPSGKPQGDHSSESEEINLVTETPEKETGKKETIADGKSEEELHYINPEEPEKTVSEIHDVQDQPHKESEKTQGILTEKEKPAFEESEDKPSESAVKSEVHTVADSLFKNDQAVAPGTLNTSSVTEAAEEETAASTEGTAGSSPQTKSPKTTLPPLPLLFHSSEDAKLEAAEDKKTITVFTEQELMQASTTVEPSKDHTVTAAKQVEDSKTLPPAREDESPPVMLKAAEGVPVAKEETEEVDNELAASSTEQPSSVSFKGVEEVSTTATKSATEREGKQVADDGEPAANGEPAKETKKEELVTEYGKIAETPKENVEDTREDVTSTTSTATEEKRDENQALSEEESTEVLKHTEAEAGTTAATDSSATDNEEAVSKVAVETTAEVVEE